MSNTIEARYEQAKIIAEGYMANSTVMNDAVFPNWIVDSQCFWYRRSTKKGTEFRLVDAPARSNELAFDHQALGEALKKATRQSINPHDLPLKDLTITLTPTQLRFKAMGKHWLFKLDNAECEEINDITLGRRSAFGDDRLFTPLYRPQDQQTLRSPDGKREAFIREHNVWTRDLATGKERQLTQDGTTDYDYKNAGLDTSVPALWAPDSTHLLAIQLDTREVASASSIDYIPQNGGLLPQVIQTKSAYPGAENIETYRLVVIDVIEEQVQALDYPPIPVLWYSSYLGGFFMAKLAWWSSDSQHVFFVDATRGSKVVRVVKWDTHTGITHVLIEESSDTFVKLNHDQMGMPMILPLPESNELIWFSERSDWGHLYLYDLNTGELKHPITEGQWLVRELLHYDTDRRELLLQTAGRDYDKNPYYRDICKVNVDSKVLTPLVSNCFEHYVRQYIDQLVANCNLLGIETGEVNGVSPCGQYLVTTRSRVDTIPVTILIDRNGKEILTVETADVSCLPTEWHWPEPVKLKAADNQTDIYGVVFRPPGFSPDRSYPVVDYTCSGRCMSSTPHGSFHNDPLMGLVYFNASALASLGFIVVAIEGRGTPLRNKSFLDHHYGEPAFMGDLNDRIAGIRQLAERYPYMDLQRVGAVGAEGSNNAIYALLKHSDFYTVAVLHPYVDPRFGSASLNEPYDGTADQAIFTRTHYPEDYVDSFSGKLLLIQGLRDIVAASTFRFVDALQNANKDFDMLCLPSMDHRISSYTIVREWNYLVQHLQGIEPPQGFALTLNVDSLLEAYFSDITESGE